MADAQLENLGAIEVLDEVDSTNEELMKRARAGAPHGAALRARVQLQGRGRRSHGWTSPEGGLYLSVLIKPTVPDRVLSGLPVACGIGVANALEGFGCEGVQLKWPNDVVTSKGKLGGILVELGRSSGEKLAVCGMGINYKSIAMSWRDPSALPIVGLIDCMPAGLAAPSLDDLAEAIRSAILETVDMWTEDVEKAGGAAAPLTGIKDVYNELLAYAGKPVYVSAPDGSVSENGILRGVDSWGRALIELPGGAVQTYDSSRVSLRPVA